MMVGQKKIDRKLFVGSLIALFLITVGLAMRIGKSSILISGDTGTIKHAVDAGLTPRLAGHFLARQVYKTATVNPNVKQLVVNLELEVPGGLVDKYGKPVKGPYLMGSLTVNDLNEVRRYNDEGTYALRNEVWYEVQIRNMNYVYLLKE